jgi:hypothetical protein
MTQPATFIDQTIPSDSPTSTVMVQIKLRERDLNARGNGSEEFRRVVTLDPLPEGAEQGTGRSSWARDAAERITGDWLPMGHLASNRSCRERGYVPLGTIVIAIDYSIRGYRREGKPRYSVGLVQSGADGKAEIDWDAGQHIKCQQVGRDYQHTIAIGGRRYVIAE